MKIIVLFMVFFSLSLLAFSGGHSHFDRVPEYHRSSPPSSHPTTGDVLDNVLSAFLSQGITGAMLIVIGFYLYRTENQARDDRNDLTRKLEELVIRSQDNLVEVKTEVAGMRGEMGGMKIEMGNQSREMESLRDHFMNQRG
tara:strand:- start:6248 stop:6670 length:423 start_codon:yes stop_codon:yes gene_type:complete